MEKAKTPTVAEDVELVDDWLETTFRNFYRDDLSDYRKAWERVKAALRKAGCQDV